MAAADQFINESVGTRGGTARLSISPGPQPMGLTWQVAEGVASLAQGCFSWECGRMGHAVPEPGPVTSAVATIPSHGALSREPHSWPSSMAARGTGCAGHVPVVMSREEDVFTELQKTSSALWSFNFLEKT